MTCVALLFPWHSDFFYHINSQGLKGNDQLLLQNSDFFLTMAWLPQNSQLHLNSHDTYKEMQKEKKLNITIIITSAKCKQSGMLIQQAKEEIYHKMRDFTKQHNKSVSLMVALLISVTWVFLRLSASFWAAPGIAPLALHEFLEFVSSSSESDNEGLCRPCLKIITIWDKENKWKYVLQANKH